MLEQAEWDSCPSDKRERLVVEEPSWNECLAQDRHGKEVVFVGAQGQILAFVTLFLRNKERANRGEEGKGALRKSGRARDGERKNSRAIQTVRLAATPERQKRVAPVGLRLSMYFSPAVQWVCLYAFSPYNGSAIIQSLPWVPPFPSTFVGGL